jgi:hypothetical protein
MAPPDRPPCTGGAPVQPPPQNHFVNPPPPVQTTAKECSLAEFAEKAAGLVGARIRLKGLLGRTNRQELSSGQGYYLYKVDLDSLSGEGSRCQLLGDMSSLLRGYPVTLEGTVVQRERSGGKDFFLQVESSNQD